MIILKVWNNSCNIVNGLKINKNGYDKIYIIIKLCYFILVI